MGHGQLSGSLSPAAKFLWKGVLFSFWLPSGSWDSVALSRWKLSLEGRNAFPVGAEGQAVFFRFDFV